MRERQLDSRLSAVRLGRTPTCPISPTLAGRAARGATTRARGDILARERQLAVRRARGPTGRDYAPHTPWAKTPRMAMSRTLRDQRPAGRTSPLLFAEVRPHRVGQAFSSTRKRSRDRFVGDMPPAR